MIRSVIIIGAGNVGLHLGRAVSGLGLSSLKVFARRIKSGYDKSVLKFLTSDPVVFSEKADLVILAVNDDSISAVCSQLEDRGQIVVHTSGSTPMNVLAKFSRHGVLYPLQTFSASGKLDYRTVPFFTEANGPGVLQELKKFASLISGSVTEAGTDKRLKLHISAVFVSNFVNHMYSVAEEICREEDIDFNVLMPLIKETVSKIAIMHPKQAQTGPAVRNDRTTISKHLEALKSDLQKQELYRLLSESIHQKNQKNEKL
ncbi:MAG: Rossmann-like and DUF2520 domain-containing protein [Bacteroidota bacterium]